MGVRIKPIPRFDVNKLNIKMLFKQIIKVWEYPLDIVVGVFAYIMLVVKLLEQTGREIRESRF